MISDMQKQTAQAIVNIFETGKVRGDYAKVTLVPGDSGHLTYGRAQTTLASGNLHLLVKAYTEAAGAALAAELLPYLPRLAGIDLSLDRDSRFRALLRDAGHDPVMREVQDAFFDRVFWTPAMSAARALGLKTALGHAVIYDGMIHGSWRRMRDAATDRAGDAATIGERSWVDVYVATRRRWLGAHRNRLLRRTTYRMDEFRKLIEADNWPLRLPIHMRGVRIDRAALGLSPRLTVSAAETEIRNLHLTDPPMAGVDVRALEAALSTHGYAVNPDGVFDASLDRVVRVFQTEKKLVRDGIVGPATRSALDL